MQGSPRVLVKSQNSIAALGAGHHLWVLLLALLRVHSCWTGSWTQVLAPARSLLHVGCWRASPVLRKGAGGSLPWSMGFGAGQCSYRAEMCEDHEPLCQARCPEFLAPHITLWPFQAGMSPEKGAKTGACVARLSAGLWEQMLILHPFGISCCSPLQGNDCSARRDL